MATGMMALPARDVSALPELVPRTRSSHHNCRESGCELRVQSGTRIIELLVSFDSEVRYERAANSGELRNRALAVLRVPAGAILELNLTSGVRSLEIRSSSNLGIRIPSGAPRPCGSLQIRFKQCAEAGRRSED